MRRIRRILVAVKNPTAPALPAVAKAAQLAKSLDAELTLFQALSTPLDLSADLPPRHQVLGALENYTRSAHQACLQRLARRLRRRGIRVSVLAEWDHPADEAIVREAVRMRADLIVVEAHARHHGSALLRLTDWELLRRSPVPLLLVKRPGPYRRPRVLVALDPDHTFDKPPGLDADLLAMGNTVCGALRGALHAMHAFAPVKPAQFPRGVLSAAALRDAGRQAAAEAQRKLARAVRGAGIDAQRRHVCARHVPDAITEVAAQTRSTLVVMGAVSRSGLKRLLIGNTAERVLDQLDCDVLLVKPAAAAARRPQKLSPQRAAPPLVPGS